MNAVDVRRTIASVRNPENFTWDSPDTKLGEFEESLSSIAGDVVDLQEQLTRLREVSVEVERLLDDRQAELAESELVRTRLADEYAAAQEDRAEAWASLGESAAELGVLRGEVASLESTLSQRTDELAESERLRARLADDVAHAREGLIETQAALAHAETQLDAREARVAALDDEVRALKLGSPQTALEEASEPEPALHLRFVPRPQGYALSEIPGPPPRAGERVEVGGKQFRVARVGRSPLPDDARLCAFLLLEATQDSPNDEDA